MVVNTKACTRPRKAKTIQKNSQSTHTELQERQDASLILNNSVEPLNTMSAIGGLSSVCMVEGKLNAKKDRKAAEISNIPVVDLAGTPVMPCSPAKARKLLKQEKARKKWTKHGIFYIQLSYVIAKPNNQKLVIGIDPGSKWEGFSVVGSEKTVLNIMSEATTHVKKSVDQRRNMRRARRFRNMRRRPCRSDNRHTKRIPPSTRARWGAKLRIVASLQTILPIAEGVVEDIKTKTKGKRKWDASFSPMEVGKAWFYSNLQQMGIMLTLQTGNETKNMRDVLSLEKVKGKSQPIFESHCVDSWVMASSKFAKKHKPMRALYYLSPLRFRRRQLHKFQPAKGGIRRREGGTMSLGLKRGTLCWRKDKLCYVGGNRNGRLSIHDYSTGKRITTTAKKETLQSMTTIKYISQFLHANKFGGFLTKEV